MNPRSADCVLEKCSASFNIHILHSQLSVLFVLCEGNIHERHAVATPTDDRSYYQPPEDYFTCPNCDKVYSSKRDLEVHRSYCYGGL